MARATDFDRPVPDRDQFPRRTRLDASVARLLNLLVLNLLVDIKAYWCSHRPSSKGCGSPWSNVTSSVYVENAVNTGEPYWRSGRACALRLIERKACRASPQFPERSPHLACSR